MMPVFEERCIFEVLIKNKQVFPNMLRADIWHYPSIDSTLCRITV